VSLVKGIGVGLAFLVLGERSVDAGQARVAAFALAGGDDQIRAEHERLMAGVRHAKSVLAAPHPLVLEDVAYPTDCELLARAELTRAKRE
jgi:hypothetical protein